MEVLETMRSSFGSTLPDLVDPDSDECDNLYLVGRYAPGSRLYPNRCVCSERSVCIGCIATASTAGGREGRCRMPLKFETVGRACVCVWVCVGGADDRRAK